MDIDKPLDEFIPKRNAGAERKPRVSRDKRDAVPYARPPPRSTEDKWVHDAFDGPTKRGRDGRDGRDRRPPPAAALEVVSNSPCIHISGIHYDVTPADLKTIFSQAGTIVQGPSIVLPSTWANIATDKDDKQGTELTPFLRLLISYDRSGRSTGVATVEYAASQQAKVAINKFDGAMTKGQTISIRLVAPPRKPNQKEPSTANLLSRIGAGSLQDRIAGGSGVPSPRGEPRGDRGDRGDRGERGDRGDRGERRGGRGRGAPRGAAPAGGRGGRAKRGPANQADLDKELDGFMTTTGDEAMA